MNYDESEWNNALRLADNLEETRVMSYFSEEWKARMEGVYFFAAVIHPDRYVNKDEWLKAIYEAYPKRFIYEQVALSYIRYNRLWKSRGLVI